MRTDEEAAIRDRLAKLAAEGRHAEREIVAWQLAEYIMRGPIGFNPHRRRLERRARRAALSGNRGELTMGIRSCRTIVATVAAIGLLSGCPSPSREMAELPSPADLRAVYCIKALQRHFPGAEYLKSEAAAADAAMYRYQSYLIPRLERLDRSALMVAVKNAEDDMARSARGELAAWERLRSCDGPFLLPL